LGQGSNGTGGPATPVSGVGQYVANQGGSGGQAASGLSAANGVGGGGSYTGTGSWGYVRIIWPGDVRQYPSTRTTDE
jgi:hypothetical protein